MLATETDLAQNIQIFKNVQDWLTMDIHRVMCLHDKWSARWRSKGSSESLKLHAVSHTPTIRLKGLHLNAERFVLEAEHCALGARRRAPR